MTRCEKALSYFTEKHFLCSQSVLAAFSELCGLEEKEALRLGSCFGTGMRRGEVCGACTGSLMVLGLLYGQDESGDRESRDRVYRLTREMTDCFQDACGSCLCRELLGCDPSAEESLQKAREAGLFDTVCPDVIANAVSILEELIRKEETAQVPE